MNKGERSALPQARVVAVAECGTHAMFDAEIGVYSAGERELAGPLIDRLAPDMMLLADRGFYSAALWQQAASTGADLLWRVSKSIKPRPVEELCDGSWVVEIRPPKTPGISRGKAFRVRLIDYTVDNHTGQEPSEIRLFTTVMDPGDIGAQELAVAYTQRWEIETAFDELKTHQRGARVVLRSRSPDMVHQEIWGHLCCHYAIRTLMCEAAHHAGRDPDRVSFVAAINIARATIAQPGDFPPQHTESRWTQAIRRLAHRLNPPRRLRTNPRVVKRKYVSWHVKPDVPHFSGAL